MEFKPNLERPLLVTAACCLVLVTLALLNTPRAAADAAPPPEAAASDIAPGQGTHVQMVSETVVLDIADRQIVRGSSTVTRTVAVVTGDFTLRNLGDKPETMDVRFPMSFPTAGKYSPLDFGTTIDSIQTFVEGAKVPNKRVDYSGAPWAVWNVTFPRGQDVHLMVKYNALGTDWYSLLDFYYILETGAGWRGPIGRGDIIFKFPYSATLEMLEQNDGFIRPEYPARTPSFVVEGNQLRWHFENLDPTNQDNVRPLVLKPEVWQAILDARDQVRLHPDNVASQRLLARAYYAAIPIKKDWPEGSALTEHFRALADSAFRRAVELAPNSAEAHLAYARFLGEPAWSREPEPYYSQARRELQRALDLGGENEETRELAGHLDMIRDQLMPAAIPTPASGKLGMLAYIQGGDLWVQELPDGEAKRLTTDGRNRSPRWSPSGDWLAFYKGHPPSALFREGDQVWVIRKSGLSARAFPNCSLDWSPSSDNLFCTLLDGRPSAVALDGANQGELPPARRGRTYRSITAWSLDGRWLAYDRIEILKEGTPPDRYATLWRMRSDGADALELLNAGKPSPDGFIRAGWSSDSKQILFWPDPVFSASITADGVPLEAISINGGKPYTLTTEMLLHSDWMDSSGDGWLAVTEGGGRETWTNKHISVVDPASGNKMQLTDDKTAAFSPVWSPDGQHIAYVAAPDIGAIGGGNEAKVGAAKRRIWVMNRDGSGKRQVTNDPAYRDERPLWSGDGRSIIFARLDNSSDKTSLWLIPSEGGEAPRVVEELGSLPPESTWFGYYGHIDWSDYFDLWTPASPTQLPQTGRTLSDSTAIIVVGALALMVGCGILLILRPFHSGVER